MLICYILATHNEEVILLPFIQNTNFTLLSLGSNRLVDY